MKKIINKNKCLKQSSFCIFHLQGLLPSRYGRYGRFVVRLDALRAINPLSTNYASSIGVFSK